MWIHALGSYRIARCGVFSRSCSGIQAIDTRRRQPRRQQGPLNRIRRFAGQEHMFGVVHQGAEKICQRGSSIRHRQIHLRREWFRAPSIAAAKLKSRTSPDIKIIVARGPSACW